MQRFPHPVRRKGPYSNKDHQQGRPVLSCVWTWWRAQELTFHHRPPLTIWRWCDLVKLWCENSGMLATITIREQLRRQFCGMGQALGNIFACPLGRICSRVSLEQPFRIWRGCPKIHHCVAGRQNSLIASTNGISPNWTDPLGFIGYNHLRKFAHAIHKFLWDAFIRYNACEFPPSRKLVCANHIKLGWINH